MATVKFSCVLKERARKAASPTAWCVPPRTHHLGPPIPQPPPHSPGLPSCPPSQLLHPLVTPRLHLHCHCCPDPKTLAHGGVSGSQGAPGPHSPAPNVVNKGELGLNGEGE